MSTGQILTVVGVAVGTYFGYPQLGAIIGGVVGSVIDASNVDYEAPKVGDLKAPQMQYGAKIPRLYGSNRTSAVLAWYSSKRVIPGDGGGKGEPDSPTADRAEIDVLYMLAIDSPILGITRVWKNGKLVYSRRAESDAVTLAATPEDWADIRFLDGNPTQLPDPTIEAAEGVGNAPAYRHRQCVMIESLNLGQSGQLPLIEFECVSSPPEFVTRLESYFDANSTADISGYQLGAGTVVGAIVTANALTVSIGAPGAQTLTYSSSHLGNDITFAKTVECYATWGASPTGHTPILEYTMDALNDYRFRFGYYGTTARIYFNTGFFDDQNIDLEYISPSPTTGRVHLAVVIGLTSLRAYIGGVKVFENAGFLHSLGTPGRMELGSGSRAAYVGAQYTIDEFAVRFEETYTGDSFAPPATIKGPDPGSTLPGPYDLASLVEAEWARVGDPSQIDASALGGLNVRGFQSSGSVRGAFEALAPVFHFGAVASDKLYFRRQGTGAVATIPFADLAAGEGQASPEPFSPERANDEEIPDRVSLTYLNYSDDYAAGSETGDRGGVSGSIVTAIQTNVVMSPAEAKAVAESYAAIAGVVGTTARIALTDYYAELEPTDAIIVTDEDGSLYRMRITKETSGAGVRQLDLVRDDASTLIAPGVTVDDYSSSLTVVPPADTTAVLIDTAILRDADDEPGFYAVVKGASGATLFESPDDVAYASVATFTSQSHFGTCSTTLGNWSGGRVFDETNTVTVDVGSGTLASATRASLLSDQSVNACAIGVDGRWELCQFRTALLLSPGVYKLSGLLRGGRGTEWASTGHVADETFALLTSAARRVVRDNSDVGLSEFYKAVTAGRALSTATPQPFTDNGIGKKPFAPCHLRALRDASNNITFGWTRRTRLSTRFGSSLGISAPLGEASEAYVVEVYSSSGFSTLLRTISASLESAAYSAANQTTDGLTPGAAVSFKVYQVGLLGRGYAASQTA